MKGILFKIWFKIWQAPQNVAGFLAILLLDAYASDNFSFYKHHNAFFSSVSLGDYIIMNEQKMSEKTLSHEIGHQRQSKILGWLYLPLIGLPSIIGNILFRIKYVKTHFDYYNLPWEKLADRLGGVSR